MSYNFDGFQAALAIDAASPISVYRPDKMDASEIPHDFEEVIELAQTGTVIYAATPTYLLMDFYAMCATSGGNLFDKNDPEHVVDSARGEAVLEDMRRLAMSCPSDIFSYNTIELHEALATSDTAAYCPFVYGYVNYSRRGYAQHVLKAADVIDYRGHMLQGVLGGTGLAISSQSRHIDEAVAFARYALSPEIQSTLYCDCGGQPGHRAAWLDEECNRTTLNFYKDTLKTLDNAYLRPRYSGYLTFQDNAGPIIRDYVRSGGNVSATLKALNELYISSREQ